MRVKGVFPWLRVNALYKSVEFTAWIVEKNGTHEIRNGQRKKNTGNNDNYLIIIWAKIPRGMQKCAKRKCKQIKAV